MGSVAERGEVTLHAKSQFLSKGCHGIEAHARPQWDRSSASNRMRQAVHTSQRRPFGDLRRSHSPRWHACGDAQIRSERRLVHSRVRLLLEEIAARPGECGPVRRRKRAHVPHAMRRDGTMYHGPWNPAHWLVKHRRSCVSSSAICWKRGPIGGSDRWKRGPIGKACCTMRAVAVRTWRRPYEVCGRG